MTDKNFQILLNRLSKSNVEYKSLLSQAENEIHRRCGKYPSDVDFDSWIDSFHIGIGHMSVEEVMGGMDSFNISDL